MNQGESVEAPLNPMWSAKWLGAAVVVVALACWFFYDGAVAYPLQDEQYDKFQELAERGQEDRWPEVAAERGWSAEKPTESMKHSELSILVQWVLGWCSLAAGLAAAGRWAWYRGGRLAVEADELVGPRGQRVPLDAIRSMDKSQWEAKGIATVHYDNGKGAGKVKLDEWMYPEAERVMLEVERRSGVGDPMAG